MPLIRSDSVDCVVTSPPYYSQREYGAGDDWHNGSPDRYVAEMMRIFFDVRRILTPAGTLWLNLGDTGSRLIPFEVVRRMESDGWTLVQHIIWHKPDAMPGVVSRRFVQAHEHIFHLQKSPLGYFDAEAVRESSGNLRSVWRVAKARNRGMHSATMPDEIARRCVLAGSPAYVCELCGQPQRRIVERERKPTRPARANKPTAGRCADPLRHVTTIRTIDWRCACPADDTPRLRPATVFDPFAGTGTTLRVARQCGRHAFGCDLQAW